MTRLPASRSPAHRAAFTIIELLVTIGIIAALMAILVPVISRVRIAAQTAATTSQIQRITAGINNYYHDFNGYPGVVPNSSFATNKVADFPQGITVYTQEEDLALALLGGLNLPPALISAKPLVYDPAYVGTGPIVFNLNNPSKKQGYIQKLPAELPANLNATLGSQYPELAYCTDGPAPEFLDLYSEPRPLIYVRATPGALTGEANIIYDSSTSNTYSANYHYDFRHVKTYLRKAITGDPKVDDPMAKGVSDASVSQQFGFGQSGSRNAKGPGSYMIFSAGPDRIFGTTDDIIYTGGGGQ